MCFYSSVSNALRYFHSRRPVADPGDCISIAINENDRIVLKIISNDNKTYSSIVMSERNHAMVDFTYGELRDMDAQEVECEKN